MLYEINLSKFTSSTKHLHTVLFAGDASLPSKTATVINNKWSSIFVCNILLCLSHGHRPINVQADIFKLSTQSSRQYKYHIDVQSHNCVLDSEHEAKNEANILLTSSHFLYVAVNLGTKIYLSYSLSGRSF